MALRGMGPAAKPAMPTLRKVLHDRTPRVRDLAAQALAELEGGGEQAPRTRSAARITSGAAVSPSFGPDSSGDWPQFHGPRRDALCSERGLLAKWPAEGPRLLWKWEVPGEAIRAYRSPGQASTRWATAPSTARSPSSC